jgi:UDP-N-acetylenolpyruvoylglucosamine reductase
MMMNEPRQFASLRGTLTVGAPLARHTTWRCGGPADRLYEPADRDDLAVFLRQIPPDEPVTVLGLGSNTLIRDGGIRGTVVVMHNPGAVLAVADGLVYAEASVSCPKVARFAALHACAGAEFLAGVPGTIGGALAMNAGCYGGETWRNVVRVEVVGRDGRFEVRTPADYAIGYRSVRRVDGGAADGIFTAAWFMFSPGDAAAARAHIKSLLARRIAAERGQRFPQSGGRPRGAPH